MMELPANSPADSLRRRPSPSPEATLSTKNAPLMHENVNGSPGTRDAPEPEASTVLYLAYGSNLSAETFQKKRGIRPLSQVNVYTPLLEFNLDLPGIPYLEPCFANVNFRKPHEKSGPPDPQEVVSVDPWQYSNEKWDGGLMGVVYEVTHDDYRQIIRTEGGGSGYKEIVIPCVPLHSGSSSLQEQPSLPIPRPFLARTLYAPPVSLPLPKMAWWKKFTTGRQRPNPGYSQASARYLKLITDGAREHDLPAAYQKYLLSLQPYTITTLRQQFGRAFFAIVFGPVFLALMAIAQRLADEDGKYPKPIGLAVMALFNSVWFTYDHVGKVVFGNGERTESGENAVGPARRGSILSKPPLIDEEKLILMGE